MSSSERTVDEPSLAFGGQALIEGVMMRSGTHMVTCIRRQKDDIVLHSEEVNSLCRKHRVLGLPFLRGVILLFETMYYGMKSVFHSANVALGEEDEIFTWREYLIVILMVLAMSSFFIVVPFLLTTVFNLSGVLFNVVEAALRLLFFVVYLFFVSRWAEFERVLRFHGAEHKAVNAYEAGAELDVENVAKFSRLNPRCGTSFLFIVVIISIILFSMIPRMEILRRIAFRLLMIPALGAISYELLKFSDKYRDSPIMKILTAPGLIFQRLTTKEPDNDMIEVAVKALEEVTKLSGNKSKITP